MEKVNFPENILLYKNQAYLTVQKGETILYDHFLIMAQIIPTVNVLAHVDSYECLPDEVKTIRPLYETVTGNFKELRNIIGLINIKGDQE